MIIIPRPRAVVRYSPIAALLAAACVIIVTTGAAGNPSNGIGPIHFHGNDFHLSPAAVDFHNGFTITSTDYDVTGVSAHVTVIGKTYAKLEVWGDPATKTQLTATFKDASGDGESAPGSGSAAQSRGVTMEFFADHAVLVPDETRPDGKKATFTGNVHVKVYAPADLAQPSVATMDDGAVVLLGDGPDYPQFEAQNVDGTAIVKSE